MEILFHKYCSFCLKQKSVEATINLRYVTEGHLKKSKSSFNPESGQITLSLNVEDLAWEPRMGRDKWDPNSRTFMEVGLFQKIKTFFMYEI